jgi:uncharacterized protein
MRREDLEALTKQDLLELARKLGILGRSSLSKDGLVKAVLKVQSKERKPIFDKNASKGVRSATRGPAGPAKPAAAMPARARGVAQAAARATAPRETKAPAPRDTRPSGARDAKASAPRVAKPMPQREIATKSMPQRETAAKPMPPREIATRPMAAKEIRTASSSRPAFPERRPAPTPAPVRKSTPPPVAERRPVVVAKPAPAVRKAAAPAAATKPSAPAKAPRAKEPEGRRPEERRPEAAREPELRRTPRGAPLRMPDQYGIDRIALMARDPYWLHAYWEVTPTAVDRLRKKLGDEWHGSRTVLRVYDYPPDTPEAKATSDDGENRYDIDLPAGSNNWYINVGRPDRAYRAAVGVISRSGKFHAYARSNIVNTPRDSVSSVTDEEWAISPEAFNRLYELSSPERFGGGRASAELGMLLRERLRSDWASGMLASMGSGELLAQQQAPRGFWFVLDAELIVYGATEADATVTVQGKPVQLRPDGTFSLRFLLPDGTQVIDATAVSADRVFRKTITPTVRRETSATEMIESKSSARR